MDNMKTRCYCVGCKLHPLHARRSEFKAWVTGWDLNKFILGDEEIQGADVTCLNPMSDAFDDLDINPNEHEFPVTAYCDMAETGFAGHGYNVYAICANEDHED